MMKKVFFAAFVLLIVMGFAACSNKQVPVSTVNLQLQNSVDSLLKQGMGEALRKVWQLWWRHRLVISGRW